MEVGFQIDNHTTIFDNYGAYHRGLETEGRTLKSITTILKSFETISSEYKTIILNNYETIRYDFRSKVGFTFLSLTIKPAALNLDAGVNFSVNIIIMPTSRQVSLRSL